MKAFEIVFHLMFLNRRFIESDENDRNMFDVLVEKAKSSSSYRTALGGNAPVRNSIFYFHSN